MGEKLKAMLADPRVKARLNQLRAQRAMAEFGMNVAHINPAAQPQFPKKLEVEWDDHGKLQSFSINGEEVAIQRDTSGRILSARVGGQELIPAYNPEGLMKSLNVGGMDFNIKRKQGLAAEIGSGALVFSIKRNEEGRMTSVEGRVVNQ